MSAKPSIEIGEALQCVAQLRYSTQPLPATSDRLLNRIETILKHLHKIITEPVHVDRETGN